MRLLLFNLATDVDDPILGFTTRWIGALAERVEFIHVITMRAGRFEVPHNVRIHSVGKEKEYGKARRLVEFYSILLRILRDDHVDVCFSHMMPLFTVLGAPLLKTKGIPITTWYAHPSVTWVLRAAHQLSNAMVASVPTAYPYKYNKLTVIGHGIDTDLFSPGDEARAEDPPTILCVGRLSPVKDHLTLLKATWLLRRMWKEPFRVVFVGGPAGPQDEAYVRSLRRQVRQLKLEGIVSFEPPVPMRKLPLWYRRCSVHVNMSPLGFGDKVAWEAMSCGKPSLVANDGFRETLGEYAERLLYRHGDPKQLAERLKWVLALPQMDRDIMGGYLRNQVESMHRLDRLATRLVNLFESAKRSKNTMRADSNGKNRSRIENA